MANYDKMSKEQLLEALRALEREPGLHDSGAHADQVIHDLQVHQIELEMQNRELRETQQRLEESRSRYADLYDFAPVGYCTVDRNSAVLEANLTAAALFGKDRASLVGGMLILELPSSERSKLLAHLRTCFRERTRATSDLRLVGRSGPLVLQLVSTPVLNSEGDVVACKTAITDISLIKQSEERLRLLATVSEVLTASFDYTTNLAQVVRLLVPQFADICILDVQQENQQIQRLEVAVVGEDSRGWAEELKRHSLNLEIRSPQAEVLRSGQPLYAPTPAVRTFDALGTAGRVMVSSRILVPLLSGGRALGVFTFAMTHSLRSYLRSDLSFAQELASRSAMAIDTARLYEEAQRAIRARQDILSVVCHDLRNPLSIVRLGCKILVESSPRLDPRMSRRQLELMLHAAEQMDRMITDLLDVSSIEAGHLAIEPTEHSLKELVHDAFEMLSPFAQQKRLELRVDVANETMVRCDRERLLQVFANLGGNAVKFAPPQTPITLGADILNGMVRFSIEDRGPGIAPELMSKLFDRYSQARETAKKGRGLGLFISKGLVEAQGGKIWVETQTGGGTTFFFTLPLAAAAEPKRSPISSEVRNRP